MDKFDQIKHELTDIQQEIVSAIAILERDGSPAVRIHYALRKLKPLVADQGTKPRYLSESTDVL